MKFLENTLKKFEHHFKPGGKLEKLHPIWDAQDTFLFTPSETTHTGPHIRDAVDMKRYMITVVVALIPAILMGMYNAGYQSAKAYDALGSLAHWQILVNGAVITLPIILVSYAAGGFWEVLFAVVRNHKINEGFLVTGILFPLTLPPTIPLWQVAVGISFGVVIGKEIFGGTGMNILNPALTGRVFLFFSYPAGISGDKVWVYLDQTLLPFKYATDKIVDSYTGATSLLIPGTAETGADSVAALSSIAFHDYSFMNMAIGLMPGSIGETSAVALLLGALILVLSGVGNWRIMVSAVIGAIAMALLINGTSSEALPALTNLPIHYHFVMGGLLFGIIFMATDPVSASATDTGKIIYGFMIGALIILVRVWNPAYPEGTMLAILFMNIFSPTIDYFVIQSNSKRRLLRAKAE